MNLSDALGESGQQTNSGMWPGADVGGGSGGFWPGSNPTSGGNNPVWPGPSPNQVPTPGPVWPGPSPNQVPTPGPVWPGPSPNQVPTPGPVWPGPSPNQVPTPGPVWPGPSPNQKPGVVALQNPSVPYKLEVNGGVHNKRIKINGVVNRNADKFIVDLGAGGDLAFHFNPRFNENGKQVIVRNTRIGNKWGKEERQLAQFPFRRGQEFKMEIFCQSSKYEVTVDGQRVVDYNHRITNLNSVNKLTIHSDLTLKYVEIV